MRVWTYPWDCRDVKSRHFILAAGLKCTSLSPYRRLLNPPSAFHCCFSLTPSFRCKITVKSLQNIQQSSFKVPCLTFSPGPEPTLFLQHCPVFCIITWGCRDAEICLVRSVSSVWTGKSVRSAGLLLLIRGAATVRASGSSIEPALPSNPSNKYPFN